MTKRLPVEPGPEDRVVMGIDMSRARRAREDRELAEAAA